MRRLYFYAEVGLATRALGGLTILQRGVEALTARLPGSMRRATRAYGADAFIGAMGGLLLGGMLLLVFSPSAAGGGTALTSAVGGTLKAVAEGVGGVAQALLSFVRVLLSVRIGVRMTELT